MRYAVTLPNFGEHWHSRTLARLARDAESAGWDAFFIWDHALFDPRGGIAISDPWVALAAIALGTERIKLGTMVTPLPRRRPWKLARETVSLDRLSDGRLILGVGLGAPEEEEFAWVGEETDNMLRAARLDEGLAVLTGFWTGERFAHVGAHYRIRETIFRPKPVQAPRIPIWVAATWPKKGPFRRAARWDGVCPVMWDAELTPGHLREIVGYTSAHRASSAPFDVAYTGRTTGDDAARDAELAASYADAGATWWVEALAMWRFSPWEPRRASYVWPTDQIEARIRQGPPR